MTDRPSGRPPSPTPDKVPVLCAGAAAGAAPRGGFTILALDMGASTGWATSAGESGTVRFDRKLTGADRTLRHGIISRRFHDWLCDAIQMHQPAVVVVESAGLHSNAGSQGVMRGVLLLVCSLREVLVDEVAPNSWQAWAKKRGWTKADKSDHSDALNIRDFWLATRADTVTVKAAA